MRDFFITGLEWVIHGIVLVAAGAVTVAAIGIALGGLDLGPGLPRAEGFAVAAAVFVAGMVGVLVGGGALYLLIGIYANTRRTADALELLISLRRQ